VHEPIIPHDPVLQQVAVQHCVELVHEAPGFEHVDIEVAHTPIATSQNPEQQSVATAHAAPSA
jgi:hypothetical protein